MKHLLIVILLLPNLSFAEKKITQKDMSILGKIDESNFKTSETKAEDLNAGPSQTVTKTKAVFICKEQDGREFKQGEVGYDTCLNGLKNRSGLSKRNSGVYDRTKKDESGAGVSFKIGN